MAIPILDLSTIMKILRGEIKQQRKAWRTKLSVLIQISKCRLLSCQKDIQHHARDKPLKLATG